jgi:hypothetical protein
LLSCGLIGFALVWSPSAFADPVILLTTPAKTGNPVTFTGPGGATDYSWDLNGDGLFAEGAAQTATWGYDLPGTIVVGIRYTDATGPQQVFEQFYVAGPLPDFLVFPGAPTPGEAVSFVYSGGATPDWDLNGDGVFGDATTPSVTQTFASAGAYLVGLRVGDPDGAVSTGYRRITVTAAGGSVGPLGSAPQLRLMSPFPVVRITGKVNRKGARIKRLTVRAPYGATVRVRCRGKGCPFRRTSRTLAAVGKAKTPAKTVRIKRLEHRLLRGGASVKVFVSRQGELGKYTRFLIRKSKPPRRTDLCLEPGATEPSECPAS